MSSQPKSKLDKCFGLMLVPCVVAIAPPQKNRGEPLSGVRSVAFVGGSGWETWKLALCAMASPTVSDTFELKSVYSQLSFLLLNKNDGDRREANCFVVNIQCMSIGKS